MSLLIFDSDIIYEYEPSSFFVQSDKLTSLSSIVTVLTLYISSALNFTSIFVDSPRFTVFVYVVVLFGSPILVPSIICVVPLSIVASIFSLYLKFVSTGFDVLVSVPFLVTATVVATFDIFSTFIPVQLLTDTGIFSVYKCA